MFQSTDTLGIYLHPDDPVEQVSCPCRQDVQLFVLSIHRFRQITNVLDD